MNSFRAAVFDLDDTVLRDDLSISARTLEIFRRLHDAGFFLVAASGRTPMSMKPFTDQLGCVSYCIASNGAQIMDPVSGGMLYRETFPVELGREIARFGKEFCCYAQTYSDDRFYFNEVSEYSRMYSSASMLPGECVGDLERFICEPRSKILMMAEQTRIPYLLDMARSRFSGRASVTSSKPYFLEFNPPNATKGIALRKTAEWLGLSEKDFVAFGDSLNDLPMLRIAGRSVAVANARPEVRSSCDEVCLSNQEDGVARYLEKLFLEEVSPE